MRDHNLFCSFPSKYPPLQTSKNDLNNPQQKFAMGYLSHIKLFLVDIALRLFSFTKYK